MLGSHDAQPISHRTGEAHCDYRQYRNYQASMTLKLYRGDDSAEPTPTSEQLLGQFIPLHYHFQMLQDVDRMRAFKSAIEATVTPGMNVVELGCGTGVLSSFAARCGAKVYSVERNPSLVETSQKLVKLNGLSESISVIEGDARHYTPSSPIDVVICEMLHVGLLREKQLSVIAAFKQNYLAAFGPPLPRFIPEASLLTIQLIQQCYNFEGYQAPIPIFQPPAAETVGTYELSGPIRYGDIIYGEDFPQQFSWDRKIRAERDGNFNAVRLLTQNVLSINENDGSFVSWANQFLVLPLEQPLTVSLNEMIPVKFAYRGGDELELFRASLQVFEPMSRRRLAA
jgi:type I protein arginine methyltransferase